MIIAPSQPTPVRLTRNTSDNPPTRRIAAGCQVTTTSTVFVIFPDTISCAYHLPFENGFGREPAPRKGRTRDFANRRHS